MNYLQLTESRIEAIVKAPWFLNSGHASFLLAGVILSLVGAGSKLVALLLFLVPSWV